MAQIKYLSLEGLGVLVEQIKAGDAAALKAAKDYVGAIPADAGQSTVIEYLMAEIAKAQEAATFDGKASSVTIDDTNGYYTATTVEGALAEVKKIADDNASDLTTIKGTGEGSIKKALADAKAYTDEEIGELKIGETEYATVKAYVDAKNSATVKAMEDADEALDTAVKAAQKAADDAQADVDALETLVGELPTGEDAPTTVVGYIKSVEDKVTGDAGQIAEDLAAEITRAKAAEKANADAIVAHAEKIDAVVETLVGDDTNKSVRTIANEEIAAQLIPESAKESLDTLKEIADWIQKHPEDAAAMNKAIEDLGTLVGILPEGITATTVVGYVAELVAAEETRATGVEAGLDERLEAVEEVLGEGGGVDERITAAIEALDAEKSQEAGADGLALSITEVDGKITSISGSIAANTYDAYGDAQAKMEALQGDTTSTVADVEAKVDAIGTIAEAEITALFE